MATTLTALLTLFLIALVGTPTRCIAGATYGFDLHHRLSPTVRRWVESRDWDAGLVRERSWPEEGSVEYYASLEHDKTDLHGRKLSGTHSRLSLLVGNMTVNFLSSSLSHFAVLTVGTPGVNYMVAIDTASDYTWLPCDCKQCAPTTVKVSRRNTNVTLRTYLSADSLTSKKLPCSSPFCDLRRQCSAAAISTCPYVAPSVYRDTNSSGVLVEDILYLMTDDSRALVEKTPIIFGCGQVQTGGFLDSMAPGGLLGLGLGNISLPSTLSRAGLMSDSFSLCFGENGVGRMILGDEGSADQNETPLNLYGSQPKYNVTISGIRVGNKSIVGEFFAIIFSGGYYTYLADPLYTTLTKNLDLMIQDKRVENTLGLPFDYCYSLSSNESVAPALRLRMNGGGEFLVTRPFFVLPALKFYCLGVIKNNGSNIIGQNFMTGQRIVFNREKKVLGWKKVNCYNGNDFTVDPNVTTMPLIPPNPNAASPSPAPAGLAPTMALATSSSYPSLYTSSHRMIARLVLSLLSVAAVL